MFFYLYQTLKPSNIKTIHDISVVLPFFNAEGTLPGALESIRGQTWQDFECILVDNNSNDQSAALASQMTRGDRRFILLSEPRQGVVHAFKKGAAHARGRYLARMDADDRMHPRRLEVQQAFLKENPEFGAVGGLVHYSGEGAGSGGFRKYVQWNNRVITYDQILQNRFVDAPIVNPTAMWRRTVGEELGLYRSGDFPEDYEMWLRWLHQGVKIAKVGEVVLDWHDSPGRLTRNQPEYSDEAFYRVKTQYLALWLEDNNPHHPYVAVWGASRTSRQRARMLESYGIRITHYIDIRKNRQLDKPLLFYRDIPAPGEMFILVYVRQWHAKERIIRFMEERGYKGGVSYLLVS